MASSDNLAVRILISAQDNASKTFEFIRANGVKLAEGLAAAFALDLFKGAVDEAAKFEAQLDKVGAKGGYTAQEMETLSKAAVEIGSKFGVSGTEAAAGLEILAAAGLKSSEAINTLPSVLALAQSEAVSMDVAASTVTDTISIMGLGFSDAGRVADVFAKGANLSTTSAVELGEAFKGAGGAASASHYSLEQTAAMMNVLAANGIRGSEAGTGLKNVLSLLLDPTSNARKELSKLGVNTSDVGVAMDALQKAGEGGKQAMLAFGTEAMPTVLALTKSGSAGMKTFETALLNSKGAAEETAKGIASNFEGAKKNLEAAFINLKVALGTPILKPLTESFNTFSGAVAQNIPTIVSSLTALSELYGIKLARDAATFVQGMIAANTAKKAAQVATQSVVAAEQELVAAMAAGGTQTTRYQLAQQQLATAMTQGGTATSQYATAQNQLLTTHQTAQIATTRLNTAQTELNTATAEGGVAVQRYTVAQAELNTAKQISQGTTQRLVTVQADLNAEIAASGVNSQRAIALQNELNISQTNAAIAEQRLAAAQTELNTALAAGGTQTQRYVTALAELQAAETRAATTTATLQTETAALASSTNVAAASATRMATAFNGAMSIFAGWTIGTMIGEWANQFDFIKRRGADMSETFVQLTESARYFFSGEFLKADDGTYAAKMAEIHNAFEQIRFATTEAGKAAVATGEKQQQAAEVTKKATQDQAKVVEEFSKLQLEKLKETNAAIDAHYKLENDAIALNLKLKTESIKSTYDDQLAKEKAITEATISASNQEITNLEAAATKKKSLVNSVYQDAIEKSAAGSSQRAEYEKQYLEASQEIYQSLYNSYAQTVSNMISAAQSHRDKAVGYAQEILNAEERRHSGILELERIGMSDAELKASKKKEIEKGISDYKKAMAEGDFEKAKEISTNTEKLVLDLAKSEKTQTSEVSSAKRQYNEVIGQTEAATKALQNSENQQAADLEANAQNQIAKMNDIKGKLNEISETLNQNFLLTINVNEDAVFQASADIDALSRNEYVTVYVTTVQTNQNGGQIQAFADGGTPNFVRREGGLGGYGGGDTVPAMLEAGEWIIKKESVKKYGNGFMAKLNAGQLDDIPKFSTGGSVSFGSSNLEKELQLTIDGYNERASKGASNIADYVNVVEKINELNKKIAAEKENATTTQPSVTPQKQANQTATSSSEVVIRFVAPNGNQATAQSTQTDAKSIVEMIKQASLTSQ
jgi:TP901 family phage tail tape measure protein